MKWRKHHRRRSSRPLRQLLSVPMRSSAFGDGGITDVSPADSRPGTYTYNDAGSTRWDHEGRVFAVPKHFPAVNGLRTEINQFAGLGITDVTNWTQTNAAIAYAGGGEYLITGLDGGTGDFVIAPTILSGTSVVGLDEGCCMWIKATADGDIGTDAVITLDRASGGSSVASAVTITLTADYQPVGVPAVTGVTSNTGWTVKVSGAASSSATNCTIKDPTGVDLTSRGNAVLPIPIQVDVPDENAREIYTTANALGSVNNADSTTGVTSSGADVFRSQQAEVPDGYLNAIEVSSNVTPFGTARLYFDLDASFSLVDGKRYTISYWLRHVGTGGAWAAKLGQDSVVNTNPTTLTNVTSSDTTWTYYEVPFTHSADTQYFGVRENNASNNGGAFITGLSIKEAATGIEQFSDTNGNTVASGIITAASGDELHPFHFEQVKSGANRTRTHQVMDQYTPWSATDSVVADERRLPTDWMTNYNRQFCFYADGAGTTGGSEPDWSSATDAGDTVSDNGITWTAVLATNRGLTIEPATTQDISDAGVAASGGSASTYPTAWAENGTDGAQVDVVGYGVSPINPDYQYVDLQFSNSSGSNKTPVVAFVTSSITGMSQGDNVAVSAWVQLIAGTVQGDLMLNVSERDSGDVYLVTTGGSITPTAEFDRLSVVATLTDASVDRYRPQIRVTDLPDGADFTIRVTMPNSCQQDHVFSFVPTQSTRTTQEGAMTYPIENFDNDNFLSLVDMSFGVAIQDLSSLQSLISINATSAATSLLTASATGKMQTTDGSTFGGVFPSDVANEIYRIANHHKDGANFGLRLLRATAGGSYQAEWSVSFDGAFITTRGNIALCPSITIPVTFHGLRFMPGLDFQTAADANPYQSFDDLRYV
jgi:hypothetical protein